MTRYQVRIGSESAHCCFEASVVDTTQPIIRRGKPSFDGEGQPRYTTVCECFEQSDADRICLALNTLESSP